MNGEGEVLYTTVSQDGSCPVSTNHYAAGPLYDIKCVRGGLSQLQLPHCEASPDDCTFMTVAHYTESGMGVLQPENITHMHVTVSIPATSRFLSQNTLNFFKNKVRGQIILIYHPPPKHWLHVFLRPGNVDPKLVNPKERQNKYIQTEVRVTADGLFLRDKFTDNPTFVIYLDENTVNVAIRLREARSEEKPWKRFDLPSLTHFQRSMSGNETP
ncbi:hypothetical protein NFI96_020779, partial [Prochilodus magdalenae]